MSPSTLVILVALATSAAAKQCINATVPVNLSVRQGVFNIDIPQTDLEVTDYNFNRTMQGRNFTDEVLTGYATTAGTYNISTSFCSPDDDTSTDPVVQVLTHGVAFDKTYWDFPLNPENYSYVDFATNSEYYTLNFDRLGVGNSSHGEPLNEIQSFLEVAATVQLTKMLRNGTFPGVSRSFSRVVHVGHSFGSSQTYILADYYPELTDAIILTGFSTNFTFNGLFAAGGNYVLANNNQPERFADYPNGYIVGSNIVANKYQFMKPNFYDPAVLEFAEETKQPTTVGEFLTVGSFSRMSNFAGPVMFLTGENDIPFCGGNCLATGGAAASIPATAASNFPNVDPSNFTAYIQPDTAHGLNLHYNATGAYQVINDFLASKGLVSA